MIISAVIYAGDCLSAAQSAPYWRHSQTDDTCQRLTGLRCVILWNYYVRIIRQSFKINRKTGILWRAGVTIETGPGRRSTLARIWSHKPSLAAGLQGRSHTHSTNNTHRNTGAQLQWNNTGRWGSMISGSHHTDTMFAGRSRSALIKHWSMAWLLNRFPMMTDKLHQLWSSLH